MPRLLEGGVERVRTRWRPRRCRTANNTARPRSFCDACLCVSRSGCDPLTVLQVFGAGVCVNGVLSRCVRVIC